MPAQTSGLGAAPAVDRSVSIEIEDAALAKIVLDGDELQGSGLPHIVGNSALRRMLGIAGVVAPNDATVLINVETGTDKELNWSLDLFTGVPGAPRTPCERELCGNPARLDRVRIVRPREGSLHGSYAAPVWPFRIGYQILANGRCLAFSSVARWHDSVPAKT